MITRLDYNTKIYELSKQSIFLVRNSISSLQLLRSIEALALFAANNPTNLFEDREIELLAENLIKNLYPHQYRQLEYTQGCVVHYATSTYEVGGHSRVIRDWIMHDESKSVLFIRNQKHDVPAFLSNVNIVCSSSKFDDYFSILSSLSDVIYRFSPEKIVFHHHSSDIIPVLLTMLWQGLNSFMYNHADWKFSLSGGKSEIISLNKNHAAINTKYRYHALDKVISPYTSKEIVPKKLDSTRHQLSICVMGSSHKLMPYKGWNIYRLFRILSRNDLISEIHVVGASRNEVPTMMRLFHNRKIIFHGKQVFPDHIISSTDVFLESLPIGSSMATLEGICLGCYPIFCPTRMLPYAQGAAINYFPPTMLNQKYSGISSLHDFSSFIDHQLSQIMHHSNNSFSYQDSVAGLNCQFIQSINALDLANADTNFSYQNRYILPSHHSVYTNMARLAEYISSDSIENFKFAYGTKRLFSLLYLHLKFLWSNKKFNIGYLVMLLYLIRLLLSYPYLIFLSRHQMFIKRL